MASIINDIKARQVVGQPDAVVGMGATLLGATDRYPLTIVQVTNGGKFLKVQQDNYTRVDKNGFSEMQEYSFTENKEGPTYHFKQDKKGMWIEVHFNHETKRWNKSGSYKLRIGSRDKYHDFSF